MEIIRVFVASSIIEFSKERKRLGAFFTALNNQVIKNQIFFDVKFCEELDNAFPEVRKQNEYNNYIGSSDYVIFLLGRECGRYTFEEFKIAMNSKKSPMIMVFYENILSNAFAVDDTIKWIKSQADIHEKVTFIEYEQYSHIEEEIYKYIQQDFSQPNFYNGSTVFKKIRFF